MEKDQQRIFQKAVCKHKDQSSPQRPGRQRLFDRGMHELFLEKTKEVVHQNKKRVDHQWVVPEGKQRVPVKKKIDRPLSAAARAIKPGQTVEKAVGLKKILKQIHDATSSRKLWR